MGALSEVDRQALSLCTTDELVRHFQEHTEISDELLDAAIPSAIDVLYTSRDAHGNMHSSGALAAVAALRCNGRDRLREEYRLALVECDRATEAKVVLEEALVKLDRAAEDVLEYSTSGDLDALTAMCHKLDEVRGRIWATYNAASAALKAASRARQFEEARE